MSITLYKAASDVQNAIQLCVDPETGEIDTDKIDAIQASFQERAVATTAVYKTIGHRIETLKGYMDEVALQIKREEKNQERLKDYLMAAMLVSKTEKIKSDDGLLTATLYPDRDVSVELDEGAVFPPELCVDPKPPGPSKTKIRAAIESGQAVGGARIVRKHRLTIK